MATLKSRASLEQTLEATAKQIRKLRAAADATRAAEAQAEAEPAPSQIGLTGPSLPGRGQG